MTRFISTRHLSLDFLGEEWKECFIVFSTLTVGQMRELLGRELTKKSPSEMTEASLEILKEHFLNGIAFDSDKKELVKLEKKDFDDLPLPVLEKAVLFLVGATSLTNESVESKNV